MKDLVSILVPVYGTEKYIEKCVRSILDQTYPNIEIVIVNDCTPDNSMKIIRDVMAAYPNRVNDVKIVNHTVNQGIAGSRNDCIDAASGDFLFFLDSDDWIDLETIETLVDKQHETNADIVSCQLIVNEDELKANYIEPHYPSRDAMLTHYLTQGWHHELCGRLIRSSLFSTNEIRFIPGCNMAEDWRVTPMLVWYAQRIAFVNKYFYHYRHNDNSICFSSKSFEHALELKKQAYQNISSLFDFFIEKDREYAEMVLKLCAPMCYQILMGSISTKDKGLFVEFRKKMLGYPVVVRSRVLSLSHLVILRLPCSYELEGLRHNLAKLIKR